MTLSCPLCAVTLSPSSLESHLRLELDYPHLRCRLCRLHFTSPATADKHFTGSLASHPGQPVQLLRLDEDPVKEARLEELVRLAEGGRRAVEERLCVCGQCQLLCREDDRYTSDKTQRSMEVHWAQRRSHQGNEASESERDALRPSPMQAEPRLTPDKTREHPDDETLKDPAEQQLWPEPSQSESQMEDIKPDMKELKPQISSDGKVACVQCGLRVAKERFKDHALGAHSSVRPFSCNLCPHNEKTKTKLGLHLRNEHKEQMSSDTFTFVGSEAKLAELVEQCFGSAKDTDWARLHCEPCDKAVNKMDAKNHIARFHLKKELHKCRLCDYTNGELAAGKVNFHVKKVHKSQPGPDTIDSSQAQHYAPIIKNMIPQIFSQQ